MAFIPNIPKIEHDELTISYLRRLAYANGFTELMDFATTYIWPETNMKEKYNRHIRIDGMMNLQPLIKSIGLDMDEMDFLLETSIYAGVCGLVSNATELALFALRDMFDDVFMNPNDFCAELKYCPVCAKEEIEEYRYFWYKRAHNMPGVNVCHKHKCFLKYYDKHETEIGKSEFCTDPLEVEFAEFSLDILTAQLDYTLTDYKEALKSRITELGFDIPTGGYSKYIQSLQQSNYKDFVPDKSEYYLRSNLRVKGEEYCTVLLKLLYILFSGLSSIQKYLPKRQNESIVSKKYVVIDYKCGIYKLMHRKCKTIFYATKKAFELGFICPKCNQYTKIENVYNHLKLATKGEYEIISIDNDTAVMKHLKCGKPHRYRLYQVLFNDLRCKGERKKSEQEVNKMISSVKGFELISFKSVNDDMILRHYKCKQEFSIGYYDFINRPFCRACYENKIGIDIKTKPARLLSKELFEKDMQELVGDEYTLVSGFIDSQSAAQIRHNTCGNINNITPSHFTQGARCKCSSFKMSYKGFCQYVHDVSIGAYEIVSRGKKPFYHIKNMKTGKTYDMLKPIIMQEFSRKTPSIILPLQERKLVNPRDYEVIYDIEKVWSYIQEHYPKDDIFSPDEIDLPVDNVPSFLHRLEEKGLIKKVGYRMFTYADFEPTYMDLFEYKYMNRHGKHIGYWCGNTLAYILGIIDKPEHIYCASIEFNALELNRLAAPFGDKKVIRRRPIAEITNDNFRILSIIDYLISYPYIMRKGYVKDLESEYPALKKYVADINIKEFEPYIQGLENKEELLVKIKKIYGGV